MTDTSSDRPPSRLAQWLKSFRKPKNGTDTLREALEELFDEIEEGEEENADAVSHEKNLLSNIIELRDQTVDDVMIPRGDIAAIELDASQEDILALLAEKQFSRIPVYHATLDNIIGAVHIKDIVSQLASKKPIDITTIIRDLPIVSPSMPVLDLLLYMRQAKRHMAMVIDEFGGTDGLVTINDVLTSIVGDVEDEFDSENPEMIQKADGTVLADARLEIGDFEEKFGALLNEEERDEIDTLGGLVFSIAGRVPARGEVIHHKESGLVFEILEADPRKVTRLKIKNLPKAA